MRKTSHEFRALMPLLLLALSALSETATMQAQTVNWSDWQGSSAPSPREDMAMAYDQARRSTVLFGGCCNPGNTWVFDGGWHQLFPSSSPTPRLGAAMTYDEAAGNIVLFGGCGLTGNTCVFLNDTWTWDGTTWTQQFPPTSPSPRVTTIAYDGATKTSVLFGGTGSSGSLADTWEWDGVAMTWTQQRPTDSPSARQAPLAYDRDTQTIVLFGGGNWAFAVPGSGGRAYGDTWTWNGSTWEQRFPSAAPSARSFFSMAYDARLRRVVLFGGAVNGDWPNSAGDTWTWNGSDWTQIHPATEPPNRYNFGMDYDSGQEAIILFGGDSTGPDRNDTWSLALME